MSQVKLRPFSLFRPTVGINCRSSCLESSYCERDTCVFTVLDSQSPQRCGCSSFEPEFGEGDDVCNHG
jgi:hypothetical protein